MFVGVFTSRFPSDDLGLMKKYGSTVQDLAARGHNWHFYDENFWFLRQSSPTSLSWGTIHWELWLRSQSPVSVKRAQTPASTGTLVPNLCVPLTIGLVTVWAVPLGIIALNVMAPSVVEIVIFVSQLVGFNHKTEVQTNLQPIQPPLVQLNSYQPP